MNEDKDKVTLFDDGDPIVANAVAEAAPKKTTGRSRRKSPAKKAPAKSTQPQLPVLGVHRGHDDVKLPYLATEESACFDIRAYIADGELIDIYTGDNQLVQRKPVILDGEVGISLAPNERVLMPTGLIFDIPKGYSVREHPRSGCSLKEGLTLINGEGVIDSDYVEEGFMPLVNHSNTRIFIKHGQRCAQVEMVENLKYTIADISDKPARKTTRSGGFGHSGK